MNELLFFLTALLSFLGVLLAFRFWGKIGIFAWIAFATILMNIEVIECVDLFGLPVTLGNVLYGSTFLCTDILSENYNGKEARKAVKIGFFILLFFLGLSQLTLHFVPNGEDFIAPHLHEIFGLVPRMTIASVLAFLVSNTFDTYLYDWIGKKTTKIWVRNCCSTMTSQAVDTILFALIGWVGLFDWKTVVGLILTTYAIKFIVLILDTPFAYIGKKIFVTYHKEEK